MDMTYDQIERNTDRARGYGLLARAASAASNYFVCVALLTLIVRMMEKIVTLRQSQLESFPLDQARHLVSRLQELHELTAELSRSTVADRTREIPLIGSLVGRLQDATEDLGDIIETWVLSDNQQFEELIADCASGVGISSGKAIAGMHS